MLRMLVFGPILRCKARQLMLMMLVSWSRSEVKEVKGWAADAHDACVWARSKVNGWAADAHDARDACVLGPF